MKKTLWIIGLTIVFAACSSNQDNKQGDANLKNPNSVHSVPETLTDSTKLINDSVVVPDTTQGHGTVGNKSATQNR
jgi:hypothetical protein